MYNNYNDYDNNQRNLGWKDQSDFFETFYKLLAMLSEINIKVIEKPDLVHGYNSTLNSLFDYTYPYIDNREDFEEQLDNISKRLSKPSFVKAKKSDSKEEQDSVRRFETAIFYELRKIYRKFMVIYEQKELLPKQIEKVYNASELEEDPEKKIELEALEAIGVI